jgi:hypothetical protein
MLSVTMLLGLTSVVSAQESFLFPIEGERALITYIQGEVRHQRPAEEEWTALTVGTLVQAGERVVTMRGARLELRLPDKSIIRFDEESEFRLSRAEYNSAESKRSVRFYLTLGKTWANIRKIFGSKRTVQVETENAVVGVRGTVFRMNVAADKSTIVKVYSGSVSVSGPHRNPGPGEEGGRVERIPGPQRVPGPHRVTIEEWVHIVEAMQQITVSPDGIPAKPRIFTLEEDLNDWVSWNFERDRSL